MNDEGAPKRNYNSQLRVAKRPIGKLEQYAKYDMAGNFPSSANNTVNRLVLFPQWSIKDPGPSKIRKLERVYTMDTRMKNADDPELAALAQFLPKTSLAYNADQRRYQGTLADSMSKKAKGAIMSLTNRTAANKELINQTATKDQMMKQVPAFIQQIIQANANLSNVGIGPVSKKGLALYAGRWFDSTTGRVRILPNATTKYVNPSSKQGKLAYLEAKLINRWNQLVNQYASYKRLNQSAITSEQYKERNLNRLIVLYSDRAGLLSYNNYITNKITSEISRRSVIGDISLSYQQQIMKDIINMKADIKQIMRNPALNYLAPSTQPTQQVTAQLEARIDLWERLVAKSVNKIKDDIKKVMQPSGEREFQINKLLMAGQSLTGNIDKRKIRAIKGVAKTQILPIKGDANYIKASTQAYIEQTKKIQDTLKYKTSIYTPSNVKNPEDLLALRTNQFKFDNPAYKIRPPKRSFKDFQKTMLEGGDTAFPREFYNIRQMKDQMKSHQKSLAEQMAANLAINKFAQDMEYNAIQATNKFQQSQTQVAQFRRRLQQANIKDYDELQAVLNRYAGQKLYSSIQPQQPQQSQTVFIPQQPPSQRMQEAMYNQQYDSNVDQKNDYGNKATGYREQIS